MHHADTQAIKKHAGSNKSFALYALNRHQIQLKKEEESDVPYLKSIPSCYNMIILTEDHAPLKSDGTMENLPVKSTTILFAAREDLSSNLFTNDCI